VIQEKQQIDNKIGPLCSFLFSAWVAAAEVIDGGVKRIILFLAWLPLFAIGGELEDVKTKRTVALEKVKTDYRMEIDRLKVRLTQAGETEKAKALDTANPPPEANGPVETRTAALRRINGIYVAELEKLKAKAQRACDLAAVTQVEKELKVVKEPPRDMGESGLGKLGEIKTFGEGKDDGRGGSNKLGAVTNKTPLTGRVLQVLPEGLLFSAGSATYLLTDHPDQRTMADGSAVNCYAVKTEKTYSYTDVKGAKRTARIYKFVNRRIGKR